MVQMDTVLTLLLAHAAIVVVLAAVVAASSRVIRHAAVVHVLWVIVLLKLLVPGLLEWTVIPAERSAPLSPTAVPTMAAEPIYEAVSPAPTAVASTLDESPTRPAPVETGRDVRWSWSFAVLAVLLAGSFAVLGLTLVRTRRFQALVANSMDAPDALVARAADLARRFGMTRPPRIRIVKASFSPLLWPRLGGVDLLLPRRLLERLDDAELDAVLAHELAHLYRRDHWIRFLELAATVVFWWHPVVWWARHNLHRAEESSCDAWVAHVLPGRERAYAEGLLKTLEFLAGTDRPLPAAATGIDPRHDMKERLTMILTRKTPTLLSPWHRALLAAAAVALLVVVPTRADRDGEDDRRSKLEAHAALFEEQELELEKQSMELERQMRELEGERHRLDFDREMLKREAELDFLDDEARELEASGQELEAQLLRQRHAASEQEIELRRQEYELEVAMRHELMPMEADLRARRIRLQELELAGDEEAVDALTADMDAAEKELTERRIAFEERHMAFEAARIEHRVAALEERRQALADAGHEEEAAQIEMELEHIKVERRVRDKHLELRKLEQRFAMEKHLQKARQLEAEGSREAAHRLQMQAELIAAKKEMEARRAEAKLRSEVHRQEARARMEALEAMLMKAKAMELGEEDEAKLKALTEEMEELSEEQ